MAKEWQYPNGWSDPASPALPAGNLRYMGTVVAPVEDAATARPSGDEPILWICAEGVTPTHAGDGDLVFNLTDGGVLMPVLSVDGDGGAINLTSRYASPVLPEAFGAVGDGVADDTAEFQAMIATLSPGDTVLLQHGKTYLVSSSLTFTGVRIDGAGATIKGDIATVGVIQLAGAGSTVEGLTVQNTRSSGCIAIEVAQNATDRTIRDCTLAGTNAQGIAINSTGVDGVLVEGCYADGVNYGFLSNTLATDLVHVRLIGNRFINCSADPIALNHPIAVPGRTPYTDAPKHFAIIGNQIEVPNGTSSSSGFGISIAGACHVMILGNTISNCRFRGVHIEDSAQHISIIGNTITGIGGGSNSPKAAIYSIGGSRLTVVGNTIRSTTGKGIHLDVDASYATSRFTITDNVIETCTEDGIWVSAITAAGDSRGVIAGNVVTDCGGDGIEAIGATLTGQILVRENVCTGNTGYGLVVAARAGLEVGSNLLGGNTAGEISKSGTVAVVTSGAKGSGSAAAGASATSSPCNLFAAGSQMRGQITVQAQLGSSATVRTWDLTWDNSTLTATQTSTASSGSAGGITLSVSSGQLRATVFNGGGAQTAYFDATFIGTRVL